MACHTMMGTLAINAKVLDLVILCKLKEACLAVSGFLQREYDVTEGDRLDTIFKLDLKGMTGFRDHLHIFRGTITAEAAGTAGTLLPTKACKV